MKQKRNKKGRLKKGNIPWNKGKKGLQIAWNKGLTKKDSRVKKYTIKSAKSRIGRKLSEEHKEKIRKSLIGRVPWNAGIPTSAEVKKKLSKILSGNKNPFYGKKHTCETKFKISQSRKGKNKGKDNFRYLGDYLGKFKKEIIKLYKDGFSTNYLGEAYNVSGPTIGKYLKKWRIELKPSIYGYKGEIICNDYHKVKSAYEAKIDNFLSKNKIKHNTNGLIIKGKSYRYDFYLPKKNLYIEYWGLERFEKYKKRKIKKLKLYKNHGINLLSINPNENILKKLNSLIKK